MEPRLSITCLDLCLRLFLSTGQSCPKRLVLQRSAEATSHLKPLRPGRQHIAKWILR